MSIPKTWLGWCAASLLIIGVSVGCSSSKKAKSLQPLSAPSWRVDLPVPGFGPATVALPLGSTTPRPIVVVLHGSADRPEWQCGSFRGVLGPKVFVVCPQGIAASEPGRFSFGSVDDTSAELRAALKEVKTRFGAYVAPSPIVLIGYAEGAELAAELARQEPSFFARVALLRADPSALSPSAVAIFAQRGGKRVLFFCTDGACDDSAVSRAVLLTRAGVPAKSARKDLGPYLDEAFTTALLPEVSWLLEGDARFKR